MALKRPQDGGAQPIPLVGRDHSRQRGESRLRYRHAEDADRQHDQRKCGDVPIGHPGREWRQQDTIEEHRDIEECRIDQTRHHQAKHLAHAGIEDIEAGPVAHSGVNQPWNLYEELQHRSGNDTPGRSGDSQVAAENARILLSMTVASMPQMRLTV